MESQECSEERLPDFITIYTNYADGFEQIFVVQQNGTLRCDDEHRVKVPAWYNCQLDFIRLFTTFEPPSLGVFNKMEMLRAYCFAFLAYHKVCDTIGRRISPNYTPGLVVDD